MHRSTSNPCRLDCSDLKAVATLEFATFRRVVAELFGPEEAKRCAEDWLDELASRDGLPGQRTCEWRLVTVAALARLAIRMTVDLQFASTTDDSVAKGIRMMLLRSNRFSRNGASSIDTAFPSLGYVNDSPADGPYPGMYEHWSSRNLYWLSGMPG
jgi:hypothetical protein